MSPRSPFLSPDNSNTASIYLFVLLNAPSNASKTLYVSWTTSIDVVAWADEFSTSSGTASLDTDIGAVQTFAGSSINEPAITPAGSDELFYALAFPENGISAPTAGTSLGSWVGAAGGIDSTATGGAAEYDLSASAVTGPDFTDVGAGDVAGVAMLAISPQSGILTPAPSVCGNLSQLNTDDGNAQYQLGVPCVTGANAGGYTVSSISYWVGSPTSTSFDLGIYADSSGSPGALLCHASTGTITPTTGWNSVNVSGCPTLSTGTIYWMGYITGSNQIQQGTTPGACPSVSFGSVWGTSTQSSVALASPFGASTQGTSNQCYSMYLTLNPVAVSNACGETAQSALDGGNSFEPIATPCLTGSNSSGYSVSSISYWVGSPTSTSFGLGVYANSSGAPGSLLCHASTGTIAPVSGWNSVSVNGCPTLSSNITYWIGYVTGADQIEQGVISGTCPGTSLATAYSDTGASTVSLANPFGASGSTTNCYSMYMTLSTGATLPTPTLSLSSNLNPATYGQPVSLTATISSGPTGLINFYSDGSQIGQAAITGTTATLITSGVPLGTHSITTTWPGNASYNPVSSSAITQTINVGTPVITWPTPAPLLYGSPLTAIQLDASANVPGAFVYTPASGAVLSPGAHTLSVTFTPTDTTDYTATTETNTLNVTISPSPGIIATIAGNGYWGYSGDGGQAINADMEFPAAIAVDSAGNIYIPDNGNNVVRKVSVSTGVISTIAGTGTEGYSGDGGPATSAELDNPIAVAVDASGNVYIADENNNRIRKVTVSTGMITTAAGTGTGAYSGDNGAATTAELSNPEEIAFDAAGNLYIADTENSVVREVAASTGFITTVAGNHSWGDSGDGGPATGAAFFEPTGVAVDEAGNLYVSDGGDSTVREVAASTGIISTVAGNRTAGYSGDNGPATSAELNHPYALAVDATGNVYIADYGNFVVRKMSTTGVITTVAGNGIQGYSGDGGPATDAELTYPRGVVVDSTGDIYVADTGSHVVRVVGSGQTATPTFSPSPGTYSIAQTVSISDTIAGAVIYYTLNGSTPTTASSVYSGPITVSSTETIEAIAEATGYSQSIVASATYTISAASPAATPTFSPTAGTYSTTQTVSISDTTAGAAIYYTLNGSAPTTSSTVYSGPITVSSTETIEAIAVAAGYSQSIVASATYTISTASPAATPTFSPGDGTYSSSQSVTISDSTSGATIYYTTDGSTPTTSSALYGGTITVTTSETIKAIAVATGYTPSSVASASYTISGGTQGTSQTITWTQPSTQTATVPLALMGTASSGLPVSYSSLTPAICTISSDAFGNPYALMLAYGNCSLQAQQVGNAVYSAAPNVGWTFLVNLANQTITFPSVSAQTVGTTVTLTATASSGLPIGYTTTTATVCSISGDGGGAVLQDAGTCTIQAAQVGNSAYGAASAVSQSFVVTSVLSTPTITPAPGSYSNQQTVSISDSSPNTTIYYTVTNGTSGTVPTTSSVTYTGPISITSTATVEAIATASGYTQSAVATALYTVSSILPASGPAGTQVTIAGTGFGSTQGSNSVSIGGIVATASAWSDTQIQVTIPVGTGPGSQNVVPTSGTLSSPGFTFTVTPAITALSPSSGLPGTFIRIQGTNFGALAAGHSSVTLNGTPVQVTNWTTTAIEILALPVNTYGTPDALTTGPIVVTAYDPSNSTLIPGIGAMFTVPTGPSITSLGPATGPIGTNVTVNGFNFGDSPQYSSVTFNGVTASPTTWTPELIIVPVPAGATTGPVVVSAYGKTSNSFTYTVGNGVSGVSPTSGNVGTSVTITGTGFGASQGGGRVTFNGVPATVSPSGWSDTSIVVTVPSGATTGNVSVLTNGLTSTGPIFTLLPAIGILSPSTGPIGSTVTVSGSNFGISQGNSTIFFGAISAVPIRWSQNQIVVPVPQSAVTGPVTVTVGGLVSNTPTFTVGGTAGATINGTVTAASNGAQISGASVGALQNNVQISSGVSGTNGTYTIPTLAAGTYDLVASAPGYGTSVMTGIVVPLNGTATENVSLGSPGTISGTVTQASTAAAIVGANVAVLDGEDTAGTAVTDASGNYSITNLGAATYSVQISASGFGTASQAGVSVSAGQTTTADFSLSGQSTISYTYDELGRLVGVIDSIKGTANYTYDAVGNITSIIRSNAGQVSVVDFTPKSGPVGTSITVSGTAFSNNAQQDSVSFGGTNATATAASPSQLSVTVPSGATTGPITVTSPSGTATSSGSFTVTAPATALSISSFTPSLGLAGTAVSISGTGFDVPINDRVAFNGTPAPTISASSTSISVTVPPNATSGPIAIATPSGSVMSGTDFFVVPTYYTSSQVDFTGQISIGGSYTGTIANAGDVGMVLFNATAGQQFTLNVSGSTLAAGTVSILAPGGSTVAEVPIGVGSATLASLSAPVTGTYTVLVGSGTDSQGVQQTGSLTLTLAPDVPTSPEAPLQVQLGPTPAGQSETYFFNASAGQFAVIQPNCGPPATFGNVSVLSSNRSAVISTAGCNSNGLVGPFQLPSSGTYELVITPANGSTAIGYTSLFVFTQQTGTITSGVPVQVSFGALGTELLTFSGNAGQTATVQLTNYIANGPGFLISVLGPGGSALTSPSGQGLVASLPVTGTYTILISPPYWAVNTYGSANSSSGTITLGLSTGQTTSITPGTPAGLTISYPGQESSFTFAGTAGQSGILQFSNASFTSNCGSAGTCGCGCTFLTFSILNPDGSQLVTGSPAVGGSYGNGPFTILNTGPLPTTGTYSIVISDPNGDTGSADISVGLVNNMLGTIAPGVPTTMGINAAGQQTLLSFGGMAGQTVNLVGTNSTFGYPSGGKINLVGSGGAILGSAALSVGSIAGWGDGPITLPTTGVYTLEIIPAAPITGSVVVTISFTNGEITTSSQITPGSPTLVDLSYPGQEAEFTFSATIGQIATLQLSNSNFPNCSNMSVWIANPDGSTLNAENYYYFYLYGPNGNGNGFGPIGGTCGNGNSPFLSSGPLPATGTYTLNFGLTASGVTGNTTATLSLQ
jgi:YD repeat-containing protein